MREKRGLSPEMCLRLGRLFGTTPQFWMNMQSKVDIWDSLALHEDEVKAIEPSEKTTIARHHAILPNPSQKVASFALISADDMAVWFVDKEREIAGEKRWIIPDGLLQCSMEASSREVLEAVTTVVEEVAEEFGANTAVALSRAKAYVAENAEESDEVDARELGREVFADQPRVAERFDRAVEEGALPERVVVEKAVAKRVTKSHKIRTDTGIELTFPAEYGENSDFIEFFSTPDGRIEIALKNIGAIENR